MKSIQSVLFIVLASLSFSGFAQNPIVVNVSPAPVSMDTQRSFVVVIPQTVLKEVKSAWLKYLGVGSKGKSSELNGEFLQTGAVNKNISATPFNVFSKLMATTGGVRMLVWLDERSISNEPNQAQHLAVQKYVYDFALQQYRAAVLKELKTEMNKQKKLENDLAKLIKDEEKSVKTVSKNERAAERANDAISTNNADIQSSNYKISDQKDNVERNAADYNAAKGAKKTLGELEDDKKDLQKQNEKQGKSMDNMGKENRAEERSMVNSQENQAAKTEALEKQKLVVRAVQVKLDNIR